MHLWLVAAAAAAMTAELLVAQTTARKHHEKATKSATVAYVKGEMSLVVCEACTQLHPKKQFLFKVLTAHTTSSLRHASGIA
jgi:hypothetical protein